MPISISKIASEIAKTLSLKHHKDIAYKTITQDNFRIIIGLCAEPRPNSEFSVHTFIQALYIPFPALVYNLGDRIGYWERSDLSTVLPVIKKYYEQLPSYDNIATLIDMINNGKIIYRYGSIITKYEFLAYSYIVINQYKYAKEYLKRIIAFENDENAEWFTDFVMRAKKLLYLIEQKQWMEIRNQLLKWQKETMTALKLPE